MRAFGAKMAREILAEPSGNQAKVIALVGDLGAGKTTFTQGFLKELGVKRSIISPTFLIIRPYKLSAINYKLALHIDCYRLNNLTELLSLGFKEMLANPENIVLIEWPEMAKEILPDDTTWIKIEHPEKGSSRTVKYK